MLKNECTFAHTNISIFVSQPQSFVFSLLKPQNESHSSRRVHKEIVNFGRLDYNYKYHKPRQDVDTE